MAGSLVWVERGADCRMAGGFALAEWFWAQVDRGGVQAMVGQGPPHAGACVARSRLHRLLGLSPTRVPLASCEGAPET